MKKILLFTLFVSNFFATKNTQAQCLVCPQYDSEITPNASWQYVDDSISQGACFIYRVPVVSGKSYTFKTGCGDSAIATFDTYLELFDSTCTSIAFNDDGCEELSSKISWLSTLNGYVYLKVRGFSSFGSGTYNLAYTVCDAGAAYISNQLNPTTIQFFAAASQGADSIVWDMGDGTFYYDTLLVTHNFLCGGNFEVKLTAFNDSTGCNSTFSESFYFDQTEVYQLVSVSLGENTYSFHVSDSADIVSYMWVFGNGDTLYDANPTYTFDCPGFYYVDATLVTAQNCTIFSYIYVDIVGENYTITYTNEANTYTFESALTSEATDFYWMIDGQFIEDTATPVYTFPCNEFYYADLYATLSNGCEVSTYISVQVEDAPSGSAGFTYTQVGPNVIQFSDTSTGEVLTHDWYFEGVGSSSLENPLITFPGCGFYFVDLYITTADGCNASASQEVSVGSDIAVSPGSNSPVCNGETLQLGVGTLPNAIYEWQGPNGFNAVGANTSINNVGAVNEGTYTLSVIVDGCENLFPIEVDIIVPNPVVSLTGNQLTASDDFVTYQWINCQTGLAIPGQQTDSFNLQVSGSYAVIVTTEEGCADTSLCYEATGIGMDELSFENAFVLFPNPADDVTHLVAKKNTISITSFKVYSVAGSELICPYTKMDNGVQLSSQVLPKGVYLLEVLTNEGTFRTTLIK